MKKILCIVWVLFLASGVCRADGEMDMNKETVKRSYSVGFQVGGDFRRQGLDINPEVLLKGIQDALSGAQPVMSEPEMKQTLVDLQKRVEILDQEQKKALARKNSEEGKTFLNENAGKEWIKTLPSGLQYRVITEGEGTGPGADDTVTVHYRGTFIDGKEFDSSYKRNQQATFKLNQVIRGWTEGLQLMRPGAKYRFFIPPHLAYGKKGAGSVIGPNSTLIFEVELLSVGGN
ncbi:MAG: FKBP-type peptidyl-prolyl cis-trans isomerase [bacterium]|nr:FKBP-type peptidyl-prolyl cis-trans isomerase [bacterium]